MDNENGTAVVVAAAAAPVPTTKVDEPKVAEITASTKTDAIDTPIVETVKNAEVANLDAKLVEAAVKPDELKALNTKSTSNEETTAVAVPAEVSKTTTTVTVNVTQTKVTVGGGDAVDKGLGEVVSTVSSIAEAAVGAIEHELKKPTETAEANSVDNDVEMIDADAAVLTDCEMKDVSLVEEQPQVVTTTTASTTATGGSNSETKAVEADSVNSVAAAVESTATPNEAEQKIAAVDDVEKNISNLFNGGDDNVVSTNDKSGDDASKDEHSSTQIASSQGDSSALNNGTVDGAAKDTKSRHDAINDNNDLVSILAGNDKPEENISSSSASKPAVTSEKDAKSVASTKSQITSSSSGGSSSSPSKSTTSPTTTTQKQSEVTPEKVVSTASEPVAVDAEKGLGSKASRQELISSLSSTSPALSSTVSGSEASSDNLKKRTSLNGLSDEVDAAAAAVVGGSKASPKEGSTKIDSSVSATPKTPITPKITPEQSIFNVNIYYENSELVSFNVEKQGTNKTDTQNSSSTPSSSEADGATPQKTQQEVKGTVELCTFIIDHFEKLRTKLTGTVDTQKTPATSGRGRGKSAANVEPTTPSVTSTASKRKRGSTAAVESPAAALNDSIDSEAQPKSAKKAKKEPATPKTPAAESEYPEKAVLARWVDKKFYAGRVIEQKPNNKFVVLFEDGAKKTLPEDHIVFGKENNILPLVNESVHALVGNETYEPGTVQSVESKDDGVYYTVTCESQTVTVTSSDIYLEEEQAKVILSKHASNNPEPGFSGGLNTRKDRRNKRYS